MNNYKMNKDMRDEALDEEINWFRMASKLPNTDADKLKKWETSIDERAVKCGLEDWKDKTTFDLLCEREKVTKNRPLSLQECTTENRKNIGIGGNFKGSWLEKALAGED